MNVAPDFNNHLWSIDLFRSIIIVHWRFLLLTEKNTFILTLIVTIKSKKVEL